MFWVVFGNKEKVKGKREDEMNRRNGVSVDVIQGQ